MLLNGDVKSLEVVVAGDLSGDKVLAEEIRNKLDIHSDNQIKFKLPDRLTAKRFIFKLLYGATDYGFFTDPDFLGVGYSKKQWADVIDRFYGKYRGIATWHNQIIAEAQRNRVLRIPSGRYFPYAPEVRYGTLSWPITTIKNYPIQGYGADLVMLARIECKRLLNSLGVKADMVCTIHDSIVLDTPDENLDVCARILLDCVEAIPRLVKENFGCEFSLPITAEVQYGKNKRDMQEYSFSSRNT